MPGLSLIPPQSGVPGPPGPAGAASADTIALPRLERQAMTAQRTNSLQITSRIADASVFTEPWANTAAWSGTGAINGGWVVSSGGLTRALPTSRRWVARTVLRTTGLAGSAAYFGVGPNTTAANLVGIGQGSASTTAAILRGANIAAGNVTIPRAMPALAAGQYILTVAADETHVSFTIQGIPANQYVFGARVARSAFPTGDVNTLFLSSTDPNTLGTGMAWGPVVVYSELAIPPLANRTVGGTALFGAGRPLVMLRSDPATGIGHLAHVPGDLDSRVPAPMVLFMHQADSGVAFTPFTESRMANVLAALTGAGYILLSSDNGPGTTPGGAQDKLGSKAGLDDYAAAVRWAQQRFNTGALMLLGPSQGSFFAQNMLHRREVGGIAAVATISGGSDLVAMEQHPSYQASLRSIYGASSSADFAAKSLGFDPAREPSEDFRGVPQRFYVGTGDTTAPPGVQVTPFADRIRPFAPEAVVVSSAVGHLDDTLYQGADLVAFYDRYR